MARNPIEATGPGAAILHAGPCAELLHEKPRRKKLDRAGCAELIADAVKLTMRIGAWI